MEDKSNIHLKHTGASVEVLKSCKWFFDNDGAILDDLENSPLSFYNICFFNFITEFYAIVSNSYYYVKSDIGWASYPSDKFELEEAVRLELKTETQAERIKRQCANMEFPPMYVYKNDKSARKRVFLKHPERVSCHPAGRGIVIDHSEYQLLRCSDWVKISILLSFADINKDEVYYVPQKGAYLLYLNGADRLITKDFVYKYIYEERNEEMIRSIESLVRRVTGDKTYKLFSEVRR